MWNNGFGTLAPNSQVVQSSGEAAKPLWDQYEQSKTASDASYDWLRDAVRGQVGARFSNLFQDTGAFNPDGMRGVMDYFSNAAVEGAKTGNQNMLNTGLTYSGPGGPSAFIAENNGSVFAPDEGLKQQALDIEKQFGDRERGASQAYGQMQGGNYFGGMLNEGYSDPFSGQIGAPEPRQGGLGGLGGMATENNTWNPVAPQQRRAGSWGTAFGGW